MTIQMVKVQDQRNKKRRFIYCIYLFILYLYFIIFIYTNKHNIMYATEIAMLIISMLIDVNFHKITC